MAQIKVISHLKEPFTGRYDGVDYDFEPDVPVVLTLEAATFIFDLGKEDKGRALNQLGFLIPGKRTSAEAHEMVNHIQFIEGRFKFDDDEEDPDDTDAPAGAGKKTGGRRPHVDPSGGAGGAP